MKSSAFLDELERQRDWEETDFWTRCPHCDLDIDVDVSNVHDPKIAAHTGRYPKGSDHEHRRTHSAPMCDEGSELRVSLDDIHWNGEGS